MSHQAYKHIQQRPIKESFQRGPRHAAMAVIMLRSKFEPDTCPDIPAGLPMLWLLSLVPILSFSKGVSNSVSSIMNTYVTATMPRNHTFTEKTTEKRGNSTAAQQKMQTNKSWNLTSKTTAVKRAPTATTSATANDCNCGITSPSAYAQAPDC